MTDLVEQIARAICRNTNIAMEGVTEAVYDNPDFVIPGDRRFDKTDIPRWKLYVSQARAAIEAMKHYTYDMEQAGMAAMARNEPFEDCMDHRNQCRASAVMSTGRNMTEDQKYELAVLAEDYEHKRQFFECQRMLNTWGKSAEKLQDMAIAYHTAEAEMWEAKGQLDRAKLAAYQRS